MKVESKFNVGDKVWTVRDRYVRWRKKCPRCKGVVSGAVVTSYATSAIVKEVEARLRVTDRAETFAQVTYALIGDKPQRWNSDATSEKYVFLTRREARECAKRLNDKREAKKGGSK